MDKKIGITLIAVAISSYYLGSVSEQWSPSKEEHLKTKTLVEQLPIKSEMTSVYKMPSNTGPDFEVILKNKDKEIINLTNLLTKKKQEYQQEIDVLSSQLSNYRSISYEAESPKIPKNDIPLTKEEVEKYLAAPFSALMTGTSKKTKELFNALHGEKSNEQWAYTVINQINDFIQLHEFSNQLTSFNTECNGTTCQISGYEMQSEIWAKIEVDLKAQDWWEFDYLRSASSNSKEKGRFFYVLAGNNS